MMADNFPVAIFAGNDPGYFHRQIQRAFVGDKGRGARDVDQIGVRLLGDDVGELNGARTPSRQRAEIGATPSLPR